MSAPAPPPRSASPRRTRPAPAHTPRRRAGLGLPLQAIALGAATGAAAALCYLTMIALQEQLWSRVGEARWMILVVTLSGGALIGWTRLQAPAPGLEAQIAAAQSPEHLRLRQTFWVALGAIIAVGFGGAIGPEAGIVAVAAQLSAVVARRLGRTAAERRALAGAGVSGALAGVYASPAGGPVHAEAEDRLPRPVLFAAGLAGFAAFLAVADGLRPGVLALMQLPRLTAEAGALDALVALLPAAAGALAGGLFLWLRAGTAGLLERSATAPFWRPVAGGAVLGVLGMAAPLVLFSGHSELEEMLRIGAEEGPLRLVLLALAKALACAVCVAAGWLGGVIFPMCFVGGAMGAATLFLLPGIDPVLGVAAGMAAAAAVGMTRPLVAGLVMLFVLGGALAVPVFIGALAGWALLRLLPDPLRTGGHEPGAPARSPGVP